MVVALSKDKKSPSSMSDLPSRGEPIQPASQGTGAIAFADAQAIVETIHQPLAVLDKGLRVLAVNPAFYLTFRVFREETVGRLVYDLGNGQWDIPDLRELLEKVLPEKGVVSDFRVEHEFEKIGRRVMLLNARRIATTQNEQFLVAINDITETERVRWELEGQKEYAEKIIDASRDALLILGWDLRVKHANETFYTKFKVDPGETEGRFIYELGNGQWNIPALRDLLENVLPDNDAFDDFEVEHEFEKIGHRSMVLNARRIDHLQVILLAIEDITDRRLFERRLQLSNERLKRVLETEAVGVLFFNQDGGVIDANGVFLRNTGYTRADIETGKLTWRTMTPPEWIELSERHWEQLRDTGIIGPYEKEYFLKNGSRSWMLFSGRSLEDGTIVEFCFNINDLKQAEKALRESEERSRLAQEAGHVGVFDWNPESNSVVWTPELERFFGLERGAFGNRYESWARLVYPEDLPRLEALLEAWLKSARPEEQWEYRFLRHGELRWMSARGKVFRDSAGRPQRVIGTNLDITERKRQEEHVNLLMREVNHRSKNILSLVLAIARQTASTEPRDFVSRFDERVRALAASQDLLIEQEWKGADLEQLIRSQLAHFKDLIDARIILAGPPVTIKAAAAQALGMALHELATNAGKYGALSNRDGRVHVEWGLEEETSEDMFFMSWRESGGPPVKAPKKQGFGSTVMCHMAQASLDAKVELGYEEAGLSWQLRCPLDEVAQRGGSPATNQPAIQPACASACKARVLVVEDEALAALEVEEVLKDAGFVVIGPARSTPEALALLKSTACDAAVLDVKLGSETSEPVAETLIERGIPFLTLSAYSEGQRPEAFSGIIALSKPLEAEILIEQLRHCVASAK